MRILFLLVAGVSLACGSQEPTKEPESPVKDTFKDGSIEGRSELIVRLRNRPIEGVWPELIKRYPEINVTVDPGQNSLRLSLNGHDEQEVRELVKQMDVKHETQWTVSKPGAPVAALNSGAVPQGLLDASSQLGESVENARKGGDREELLQAVRAEFDARQKLQLAQIRSLHQKLALLEQRLSNHRKFKDQMIRKRVDALLADPSLSRREASSVKPETETTRPAKLELHKVQPGDTLGLFIENILGAAGSAPPIHTDPTGVRPPAMGYPMMVRADGTISLPLLGAVKIAGLRLNGVEARLKHEYTKREILSRPAGIMVSLIQRAGDVAAPRRLSPAGSVRPARSQSSKIEVGDTLGLIIENVLGNEGETAPIHTDPTGQRPPVMGYPIMVRTDGTITLPLLGKHNVVGQTLGEVEVSLAKAFQEKEILNGKAAVMASMIQKAATVFAPDQKLIGANADAKGWGPFDSSVFGPDDFGQRSAVPGKALNDVRTIRTASEFAEKLDELRRNGDRRRHEIMVKELDVQVHIIEGALRAANSSLAKAREEFAFAERMGRRGYIAHGELASRQADVTRAEARVASLNKLLELYRSVRSQPEKPKPNAEKTPKADDGTEADTAEGKVSLDFDGASWGSVLEFVAESSGLNLDVHDEVPGTLTYKSDGPIAVSQAVDILNGYLVRRGFLCVQTQGHLLVVAFKNGLPPSLVPEASPEELSTKYASLNNQLLTVTFKVDGDPQALAREIDLMLDPYPFVRIAALSGAKKLIITDLSRNLRRVKKLVGAPAETKQNGAGQKPSPRASGGEQRNSPQPSKGVEEQDGGAHF